MADANTGLPASKPALTHVAALIRAYKPGWSVRRVEREAGLKQGALKNYLKPSTSPTRMPPIEVIQRFAAAVGAPLWETTRAFAADMNIPLDVPVPDQREHELLVAYRSLPQHLQEIAHTLVSALATHTEPAQPAGASTSCCNAVSETPITPGVNAAERAIIH